MTQLRQKPESSLSKQQYRIIAWTASLAFFIALSIFIHSMYLANQGAIHDLTNAPLQVGSKTTTWQKALDAKGAIFTVIKCMGNAACNNYYNTSFNARLDFNKAITPTMILMLAMVMAWRSQPSKLVTRDPGQGKWASVEDPGIYEITKIKEKEKLAKRAVEAADKRSPLRLYAGHFISWKNKDYEFDWKNPRLAFIRERASHENMIITGAPGSGKTRGIFRQNIILDAHYGRTAVVFDLKWPQMDSGFADMPLYWHRLGRPVYLFAPFSQNSMRIPLLDDITNLDEALKLAKAIIAPPEYKEETGEYYKSNERRALAAMILTIAQGPTPTMKELKRLGEMTVAELKTWYSRQTDPEIQNALKSMFDQDQQSISSTLAGIVNKLQIFYNANVSRATSRGSNPAEIIDLHKLFREGGLLLIGIESKEIQGGEGEVLIQLIKRRIDKALLDIADANKPSNELPMTATYYLDELPGLGRMPYLMANLSQLRSKAACLMLGVQNSDQGSLVYTREYWKALSTNNLGTRIEFVRGMSKDDAKGLSEELGEYTVDAQSVSYSGHRLFTSPVSADARKGESISLEKRFLLSREEIQRFPPDLAILFPKGMSPVLVATPAVNTPEITLRTPGGKYVTIKNQLYPLWQATMGGVKDLYEESQTLFRSLSAQVDENVIEIIQSAPEYFQEWLGMLLIDGALAIAQGDNNKISMRLRVSSLSERCQAEKDIRYFKQEGWLNQTQNGEELIITPAGMKTAGSILQQSLLDLPIRGPALYWARQNAERVAGYPESSLSAEDSKALAYYSAESLNIPVDAAKEIYGVIPDLPRKTINNREFVELPLSNPEMISKALKLSIDKSDAQALSRSPAAQGNTENEGKKGKKSKKITKENEEDTPEHQNNEEEIDFDASILNSENESDSNDENSEQETGKKDRKEVFKNKSSSTDDDDPFAVFEKAGGYE